MPAVKDRWIEQAVCQVLTPIFEKEFSENSYGFRPGRKAEQAVIKALEFMNDGYDWIVDLDLSKFFDNVNQDILDDLGSQGDQGPGYRILSKTNLTRRCVGRRYL